MGSTKSRAQETEPPTCFSGTQIYQINEYRKSCEKWRLDLIDTNEALQKSREEHMPDHSLTVLTGFAALALGVILGASLHR